MNKKTLWLILGVLSLTATIGMYAIGSNSSHLSELKDFFWVPLPLALVSIGMFARS